MNNLKVRVVLMFAMLLAGFTAMAQTGELTMEVKGIKEAKGSIMIAVKSSDDPQQAVFEMLAVSEKGSMVCVLKDVPAGKVDIAVFHDVNGNYRLDMDEQGIPAEPCYQKEKVKIEEGENKIEVKLLNIKEMMGESSF